MLWPSSPYSVGHPQGSENTLTKKLSILEHALELVPSIPCTGPIFLLVVTTAETLTSDPEDKGSGTRITAGMAWAPMCPLSRPLPVGPLRKRASRCRTQKPMATELERSIRAKKDKVGLSAFTRKSGTPQRQWDEGLDRASMSQSGFAVWRLVYAGT